MNTWRALNFKLSSLSEEQVLELLEQERAGRRSLRMLQRLHQRATTLRTIRERIAIMEEALIP
jgi:hypothetical protein